MGASGHIPTTEDQTYWHMCVGGETVYKSNLILEEKKKDNMTLHIDSNSSACIKSSSSFANIAVKRENLRREMVRERRIWLVE